ncbi:MAG: FtsW/RodA/SpoVE family cell cycle protein [Clostridia bacterium]|nr:FtsW/RodA/SpoVE family cell cycle protein [Clostridia bacterium]
MTKVNTQKPIQLITLFNLIGFFVLWLFYDRSFEMVIYGVAVVGLIWVAYFFLSSMSMDDQYIFLIVSMLFSIGIVMIFRCSKTSGQNQTLWFAVALVGFFVSYLIVMRAKWIAKIGYGFFFLAVALSLFTMIFGKDTTGTGVKNWLVFGPFSIQTTEIVKYLVLFMLADRFQNPKRYQLFGQQEGIIMSGAVYVVLGIMVLQKELGTILVIFSTYIAMLYLFNEKKWIILANIGIIAVGALVLYLFKDSLFQSVYNTFMRRVVLWQDLWELNPHEVNGAGELMQSMFAIGSGGFFGTGIGLGSPTSISTIGAEKSDYIFASVCEEMGVMIGVAIVMLFFLLMYRGLRLSLNIKHKFYRTIGAGICIMFGFQTFIIIGGVTKLIPMTGITLPFVSYGGSSLVVGFMAIGFLEGAANKTDETAKAIAKKKNPGLMAGADLIGDERYSHSIYRMTEEEDAEFVPVDFGTERFDEKAVWTEDDLAYEEEYEAQRSSDGVFFRGGDLTDNVTNDVSERKTPEPKDGTAEPLPEHKKKTVTNEFFTGGGDL